MARRKGRPTALKQQADNSSPMTPQEMAKWIRADAPPEVVEGIRTATVLSEQVSLVESHSGPLPTPKDLEAYERVSPGLADRIVQMAEAERQLRIAVVQKGQTVALMRTICSTAVSLAMIGGAALGYQLGHAAGGTVLGLGAFYVLIGRKLTEWWKS